jgi:FolB domain-containing protein
MMHDPEYPDQIIIRDLHLRGIVGINPDERHKIQDVLINVTLYADLSRACESDRIEDTVNYKQIKSDIIEIVEKTSYYLIEKIAHEIALACLHYPLIQAVRIRAEKPGALRFARSVGVEVYRRRSEEG